MGRFFGRCFACPLAWVVAGGLVFMVAIPLPALDDNSPPASARFGELEDESPARAYLAPVQVETVEQGRQLAVLGSAGRRVIICDALSGQQRRIIQMPRDGSGMAVHGTTAYVTIDEPAGRVLVVDLSDGRITATIPVGHTPQTPVLSGDGQLLCVANRFDNTVALVDLVQNTTRVIEVVREPIAMVLSADNCRLFVANHLPCVRPFLDDENPFIAAEVSVIDTRRARLVGSIELPNGSQGLRGMALSADGCYLVVTHILSNYTKPTLQIENGSMNRNALSLIDTHTLQWLGTVALDDPRQGAANP